MRASMLSTLARWLRLSVSADPTLAGTRVGSGSTAAGTPTGRDAGVRPGAPDGATAGVCGAFGAGAAGVAKPGRMEEGRNTVAVVPAWGLRRSITLMR